MQNIRTRFAPSPTGYLHVGGARTALFNFLYAQAKGGHFILRIEDTDQNRSSQESLDQMIKSMEWLGIDWDEGYKKSGEYGPYRQSERLSIYHKYIEQLLIEKKVYHCFCTTKELEAKKKRYEAMGLPSVYDGKCRNLSNSEMKIKIEQNEPYTIRFKIPKQKTVIVKDSVQGAVHFDTSLIGDFIIVKSDKFPSYNFAVVIDDYLMKISHVIRGVGHLSNTPRQILIFEALGWEEPTWVHVSEIVGSDRKKLSKRHGAVSVMKFKDIGYPPEAFINYMTLLGWTPPNGVEYMSLEHIIQQFDIESCNKSPAMFDIFVPTNINDQTSVSRTELNETSSQEFQKHLFQKSKLNWISNQTIRDRSESQYLKEVTPFIEKNLKINTSFPKKEKIEEILLTLRVYLDYYSQISEYLNDFLIQDKTIFTEEALEFLKQEFSETLLKTFMQKIMELNVFDELSIKEAIKESGDLNKIKGKNLFMSVRSAVTGKLHGLELATYIKLLGKDLVLKRLKLAHELIQKS